MYRPIALFSLLTLLALTFIGCHRCEFTQPELTYVPSGEGHRFSMNAKDFGTAMIAPGDTLDILFPCVPELPELPANVGGIVNATTCTVWWQQETPGLAKMMASPPPPSSFVPLQVQFTVPNYALTLSPGIPVKPGDANADGKVNMLDLYPIALSIHEFGWDWILPGTGNSGVSTPDTSQTYFRLPTGAAWIWDDPQQPIDFVHADVNLDGIVDQADINFLKAHLTPTLLPQFLTTGYTGYKLEAVATSPIEIYNNEGRVWYDIQYAHGAPSDTIIGITFSRPVSEANPPGQPGAPAYKVLHIQGRTDGTDLVPPGADGIVLQAYWDNIDINLPRECDPGAFNAISKPLDVGVFTPNNPTRLAAGDKCFSCGVTIDDIMGCINNGYPLYQHIINVVVYTIDDQGRITAHAGECEFDAIPIDEMKKVYYDNKENPLPSDWWSNLPDNEKTDSELIESL